MFLCTILRNAVDACTAIPQCVSMGGVYEIGDCGLAGILKGLIQNSTLNSLKWVDLIRLQCSAIDLTPAA
jgi:hypothetical protein